MKRGIALLIVIAAALLLGFRPAEQTWTGEISDSHCNVEHVPISEGDPVLPSPECVKICLKSAFKYVLAVDDKAYAIANQDFADLAKFAGQEVKLTGDFKGQSITISKIEPVGSR